MRCASQFVVQQRLEIKLNVRGMIMNARTNGNRTLYAVKVRLFTLSRSEPLSDALPLLSESMRA